VAKLKVVAGDLPAGDWSVTVNPELGYFILVSSSTPDHPFKGESHTLHVANVEQVTEEKVKKLSGTAGWGLAGAALLGPLGAIGGMLIGGNKTEISFLCQTKEGKKFLGLTEAKIYQNLVASGMVPSSPTHGDMTLGEMKARGLIK